MRAWCALVVRLEVRSAGSVGSGLVSRLCVCAFVGRVVRDGCEVRLCDPRLPRCLLLVCFVLFPPVPPVSFYRYCMPAGRAANSCNTPRAPLHVARGT